MDADEEPPVMGEAGAAREEPSRVPASTWVGVAVIGAVLLGLGAWLPAWKGIPGGSSGLNLVVAAGGAVLLIVGINLAWRGRVRARSTSGDVMDGVEVFRPPPTSRVRVVEPVADEDDR
jgi:hypothetical protein